MNGGERQPISVPVGWVRAGQRIAQAVVRALWTLVIPALLAGLVLRYLIPASATGLPGLVAQISRRYAILLGAALFLVFSAVLRYWRFWLPGGRYATALPAHVAAGARGLLLREWEGLAALSARLGASRDKNAAVESPSRALRDALESSDIARAREAAASLRASPGAALMSHRKREALVTLFAAAMAGAAALTLRAVVVAPYHVLSGSMLPTFEPEDVIGGNRLGRPRTPGDGGLVPQRGDVVVFQSSAVGLGGNSRPDQLVKRVIGLPGDRISMEGGIPIINEWRVPSCDAGRYVYVLSGTATGAIAGRVRVEFLEDRTYLTLHASPVMPFESTYVVQPGEVFVLGDNRNNSLDSRAWNDGRGGGVPLAAIDARVRWFLAGTHRSGEVDLGRLLRSIDSLQAQVRVEGVDGSAVEAGIARCLAKRPTETRPPPPGQPRASSATQPSGT
jgi:signal peptidase I